MDINKLNKGVNEVLYNRIRANYKIHLKRNPDKKDKSWGSKIENGIVIIEFCPCKNAQAAFAHELLHIDLQLNGYNRIYQGLSLIPEIHQNLSRLISCIDNEFQHQKMENEFLKLGYSANDFYNDDDTKTIDYLNKILNQSGLSFISLSVDYITLLAPLGTLSEQDKIVLKDKFHNYSNGSFRTKFEKIDEIINEWKNDTSNNAEKYIKVFFENLEAEKTWICYSKNELRTLNDFNKVFPDKGFFINNSFTVDDFLKAFNLA